MRGDAWMGWLRALSESRTFGWKHRLAASVLALGCVAFAVNSGARAVQSLTQPYDIDQFRDIAAAQSLLDGRFPADPFYRGETLWYNPLLPATVALVSRMRVMSVPAALVQSGPLLNAFAPVAFFFMAMSLVGPWPALAALVALLCGLSSGDPPWATPSYSPWLFPSTFAAAFFYAGILVCRTASDRGTGIWWAGAGAMLGLTFLAHTAPALVLGLCAVASVWAAPPRGGGAAVVRWGHLVVLLAVALLVSAPLLWSVVGHYHLRVVNRAPNDWVWEPIARWQVVIRSGVGIKTAIAIAGGIPILWQARVDRGARLVILWIAAAAALFAYGYVARALGPARLPPLVPQFHFYSSLRAVGDLLFGVGVWSVVIVAVRALVAWTRVGDRTVRCASAAGLVCLTLAWWYVEFVPFRQRVSFERDWMTAGRLSIQERVSEVRERLRNETPSDAVVLATDEDSVYRVAAAGRWVVAVPAEFSNPFVEFGPRAEAQRHLWAALLSHDRETFLTLARQHGVTHVLLGPSDLLAFDGGGGLPGVLFDLSRGGGYGLFAVHAGT